MIDIRTANERGFANHGWLQSHHTFSFAGYYDPQYMGVSSLRVINDDMVTPGNGFATHSHQDMEILSYVKKGTIAHKDSMGNIKELPAGEFQLMSAGTGVTHSEYNPSNSETLEFLQIWIEPNVYGIEPGYQQKLFAEGYPLTLIASPDGRDKSFLIHQNAFIYRLKLESGKSQSYPLESGRRIYIHMVSGELEIDDKVLAAGDGATINGIEWIDFNSRLQSEALIFDLP